MSIINIIHLCNSNYTYRHAYCWSYYYYSYDCDIVDGPDTIQIYAETVQQQKNKRIMKIIATAGREKEREQKICMQNPWCVRVDFLRATNLLLRLPPRLLPLSAFFFSPLHSTCNFSLRFLYAYISSTMVCAFTWDPQSGWASYDFLHGIRLCLCLLHI